MTTETNRDLTDAELHAAIAQLSGDRAGAYRVVVIEVVDGLWRWYFG
jgi:hypothetical protein